MTTIYTGENVVIKGQITFGNDCSIWHNSVIRTENDPITIGDQTNIQDLVMIHTGFHQCPVSIGSNVTIGHSAIIHGCTIHDNCLIGMGGYYHESRRNQRKFNCRRWITHYRKQSFPAKFTDSWLSCQSHSNINR